LRGDNMRIKGTITEDIEVHIRRPGGREHNAGKALIVYATSPYGGTFPQYPRFTAEAVKYAEDIAILNGAIIILDDDVTLEELEKESSWLTSFINKAK